MALIKTRPQIRVRLPRVVYAGSECRVEVELSAKRAVAIESVRLRVLGRESVQAGDGLNSIDLISLGATLSEARELERGVTRFASRFVLPASLPPTYDGLAARTAYWIEVDVDIPWWPDSNGQFVMHVARPIRAEPRERQPVVYSSNPSGPKGREPYLELSLPDQVVASGGTLVGAVALGNVTHNEYTALTLGLVPVEILEPKTRAHEVRGEPRRAQLPLGAVREGESIPFRLGIGAIAPSDASALWRNEWRLQVRAARNFGRDLSIEVPITVVARGEHEPAPLEEGVPTLGTARIDALWRRVGEQFDLELRDEALCGRVGEISLEIWREHLGRAGLKVFGRLEYPNLGLALDGGVRTGFRRLLGEQVVIVPAKSGWEKRHYISGRERAQVESLWRSLFDPIHGGDLRGVTLADFADDHLVLELNDAGQTESVLRRFVALAVQLATALPRARAGIPAPESMADAVGAWQELAASVRGSLDLATMSVRGEHAGQTIEIATVWSAESSPHHTAIALRPDPPLGIRWSLEWQDGTGVSEGELALLTREAAERFAALQAEARAISIEPERLSALLPAPLADLAPVFSVLPLLAELSDAVRVRSRAYR